MVRTQLTYFFFVLEDPRNCPGPLPTNIMADPLWVTTETAQGFVYLFATKPATPLTLPRRRMRIHCGAQGLLGSLPLVN